LELLRTASSFLVKGKDRGSNMNDPMDVSEFYFKDGRVNLEAQRLLRNLGGQEFADRRLL
jgi:hypothetical protein